MFSPISAENNFQPGTLLFYFSVVSSFWCLFIALKARWGSSKERAEERHMLLPSSLSPPFRAVGFHTTGIDWQAGWIPPDQSGKRSPDWSERRRERSWIEKESKRMVSWCMAFTPRWWMSLAFQTNYPPRTALWSTHLSPSKTDKVRG